MIDETFHLTALDVRRYDFGRSLRGYDPERVEQFRAQVAEELERLSRLTQDLESKARNFHEQLRAFRDRDKALNEALISAQQLRADMREQAERESQILLREAQMEAERNMEFARAELSRMEDQIAALDRTRRTFIAQMKVTCERQLAELMAAEAAPAPLAGRAAYPGPDAVEA